MLKESELVLGDAGLSGIPDSNSILIKITWITYKLESFEFGVLGDKI